jgi:hypothetical protein
VLKEREPIFVDDPDSLLQYEHGVFEVVSPLGERVRVVCPPLRLLAPRREARTTGIPGQQWWRIEKIGDT